MKRYQCSVCDYIYDPKLGDEENDIVAGTSFENLPDDWTCPDCGEPKTSFEVMDD